ncbi:hypothetical protein O181_058060 [Austropuccinia psidii MF-1]|uniref:Uncharacterized protein n=1 Tax=Austropuccinia psidii MF-1 TaxID=1389203 RepID=A0A9Q3EFT0_9BASI|nr:hypothetical protein [Austropuccinia psidii MF-1]
MNTIGLESGEFRFSPHEEDIEQGGEEVNAWVEERNGGKGKTNRNSENDETIMRMEDDPNIYEQGTEPQETEALDTLANCAGSSRRGRCNLFSQASSNTFATTWCNQSFMNNMNNNMQGMLTLLMMILQQGQD